jgi:hypothetical protein
MYINYSSPLYWMSGARQRSRDDGVVWRSSEEFCEYRAKPSHVLIYLTPMYVCMYVGMYVRGGS